MEKTCVYKVVKATILEGRVVGAIYACCNCSTFETFYENPEKDKYYKYCKKCGCRVIKWDNTYNIYWATN